MNLLDDEAEVVDPLPPTGARFGAWMRRLGLPLVGAVASGALAWVFAGVLYPVLPSPSPTLDPDRASLDQIYDLRGFEAAEMIEVPAIKVTLADDNHDGLARVTLVIEYRSRDADRTRDQLESELSVRIRDALTMHISGKYAADLRNVSGKEILKLELIDILDSILFPGLRDGKVTAIYYQEFMVS